MAEILKIGSDESILREVSFISFCVIFNNTNEQMY
jgi:hypothetical protein